MHQIFVHGLGQDSSSWDKTISNIPQQSDIICPNLATLIQGKDCTYQTMYHAFSLYCCARGTPVNLCGLSLGAVLALNFAIDHPEKVSSLILIAPQYKMPVNLLKLQNIIFKFMPNSAFKGMGFDKKAFIKLTNSMTQLDFSKNLKEISCPTLVLCGEKDKANKNACEKAANLIPNARLEIIKNSGHEVNVDSPEKLAVIIDSFFKETSE